MIKKKLLYDYNKRRENSPNPEEVKMPNVQFSGQNYEVGGTNALLAQIVGYVRMFVFLILFGGELVLGRAMRNMPDAVKDIYNYMQENKMQTGMMAFFMGAVIQANLLQSGAFEIYIDG